MTENETTISSDYKEDDFRLAEGSKLQCYGVTF